MKRLVTKNSVAKVLASFAMCMVVLTANIQCVYIFHQLKQPPAVKKYRKF